jgi:hypothetical protein
MGLKKTGNTCTGMKRPHRKIMGNRKKLENVWASKTSLTDTAIKSPRKVEVTAIRKTPPNTRSQLMPERSVMNRAKITGTNPLNMPETMAPVVLASIRRLRSMGAIRSLSKDRLFLSKVMVTASMEVVPKRMDRHMTPGRRPRISNDVPDFRKTISVQATGKIIPQLMFGGFR